jgi:hypothetical protein
MNERVDEWVDVLLKHWNSGELVDYAYQVANLYGTSDISLINKVMTKLKYKTTPHYHNKFVGIIITDSFCNGFFGSRTFNLQGSEIIESGHDWITVLTTDGEQLTAEFEEDWVYEMENYIREWSV